MKTFFYALIWIIVAVGVLTAANISAPQFGNISAGSSNVTIGGGIYGPTTIAVTNISADTGGTTVIGLTNANSPLLFPFMNYVYAARFCILSEAWSGLTNGVIHWRGDGANPGAFCISPREFWFQTNWNWLLGNSGPPYQSLLVWSNDVGILNIGTVAIDANFMETCYTNQTYFGSLGGWVKYNGLVTISNGVTYPSIATLGAPGGVGDPWQYNINPGYGPYVGLYLSSHGTGDIEIWATNYGGASLAPLPSPPMSLAERVIVHCTEFTTGINWSEH